MHKIKQNTIVKNIDIFWGFSNTATTYVSPYHLWSMLIIVVEEFEMMPNWLGFNNLHNCGLDVIRHYKIFGNCGNSIGVSEIGRSSFLGLMTCLVFAWNWRYISVFPGTRSHHTTTWYLLHNNGSPWRNCRPKSDNSQSRSANIFNK